MHVLELGHGEERGVCSRRCLPGTLEGWVGRNKNPNNAYSRIFNCLSTINVTWIVLNNTDHPKTGYGRGYGSLPTMA